MEPQRSGALAREVGAGDRVILSSGATARFRRSYPKGYAGIVEISLDGAEETENTSSLILPDQYPAAETVDEEPQGSQPQSGARAPSLRMED
jgi:hypothetical protein